MSASCWGCFLEVILLTVQVDKATEIYIYIYIKYLDDLAKLCHGYKETHFSRFQENHRKVVQQGCAWCSILEPRANKINPVSSKTNPGEAAAKPYRSPDARRRAGNAMAGGGGLPDV